MAVVGSAKNFHKSYAFVVEIEGVRSASFMKASGLEMEIAIIEHFEGGSIIPDKSPGRVTVANVTLERGVADEDSDLYDWWLQVARVSENSGLGSRGVGDRTPGYKRPVEIIQMERDGTVKRRWLLSGCWPTKFKAGEWDNDADANTIESIELAVDTIDKLEG